MSEEENFDFEPGQEKEEKEEVVEEKAEESAPKGPVYGVEESGKLYIIKE